MAETFVPPSLLTELTTLTTTTRNNPSKRGEIPQKVSTRIQAGFIPEAGKPLKKASSFGVLAKNPEPNVANAFLFPKTRQKVAHLIPEPVGKSKELAFLYEASKHKDKSAAALNKFDPIPAAEQVLKPPPKEIVIPGMHDDVISYSSPPLDIASMKAKAMLAAAEERIKENFKADELRVAAVVEQGHEMSPPTMRPVSRREVIALKRAMHEMLKDIGLKDDDQYPTDMHALLHLVQEEQKVYDNVLQEIIRQVTINMVERGEILAEIRQRYAKLFHRIPKHVKQIHTELLAQRRLSQRLSDELIRAKDTIMELVRELEAVRKHDREVTQHAEEVQMKFASVLAQSDTRDDVLDEYHRLYKLQRDRLEEQISTLEKEKNTWLDAAMNLAIRFGQEHGIREITDLQVHERRRLRAASHIITIISNNNEGDIGMLEKQIEVWRSRMMKTSQSIIEEDRSNLEILSKTLRDMKSTLKILQDMIGGTEGDNAAEVATLTKLQSFDYKTAYENLQKWVKNVNTVAVRFTSDKDLAIQEEINSIRALADGWIEQGRRILTRCCSSTNGPSYESRNGDLKSIGQEISGWLLKMEVRVAGEDGVASGIIGLQNQLEDRQSVFASRDAYKPIPASDRALLRDSIDKWTSELGVLILALSRNTEQEQHKIPLHIEMWLRKIVEQMQTDAAIRKNIKLHKSMINWMVQLIVTADKSAPDDTWDASLHQVNLELKTFNTNLLNDAVGMKLVSDDNRDLTNVMKKHSEGWFVTAKSLLLLEKDRSTKKIAARNRGTMALLEDEINAISRRPNASTQNDFFLSQSDQDKMKQLDNKLVNDLGYGQKTEQ